MTSEQVKSCGQNWARCGELVAIGDLSRLRRASSTAENRVGESACAAWRARSPCERGNSDTCSTACDAFKGEASNRRRVVRHEIRHRRKHLSQTCDSRRARTLTRPTSLAANRRQRVFARISLAAGSGFSKTRLRRRNTWRLFAASRVLEHRCAFETLNDTELRKTFRRKNTPRKSFLGHARALNNLPIEVATARPTRRFAAHGGNFVGPLGLATASVG
jgi:hypothetical protein